MQLASSLWLFCILSLFSSKSLPLCKLLLSLSLPLHIRQLCALESWPILLPSCVLDPDFSLLRATSLPLLSVMSLSFLLYFMRERSLFCRWFWKLGSLRAWQWQVGRATGYAITWWEDGRTSLNRAFLSPSHDYKQVQLLIRTLMALLTVKDADPHGSMKLFIVCLLSALWRPLSGKPFHPSVWGTLRRQHSSCMPLCWEARGHCSVLRNPSC